MPGPYVAALDVAYASAAVVIDVSSHASTLTDDESAAPVITFTGALAGNSTFQLSTLAHVQRIENDTTGAFDLFIKRGASGAAYFIPQGEAIEVR